jgi:RNA polymerase sigma-70 factor (ECF subfamily)
VSQSHVIFASAYREHGQAVLAQAMRVCGPTLAIDVTQDVFLHLWSHPEKFDPARGSLRTYLLVMARNKAVDSIRTESARSARELGIAEPTGQRAADADADEALLRNDLAARVDAALEQLPFTQREAIVLAYFGGISYHQVARLLGLPEGTVKGRIRMGLQKLRRALRDDWEIDLTDRAAVAETG